MNVAFTRAAEGFPRRAFTVEDIRRMIDAGVISEDEKFELIEGEIVMMAAKGFAHELVKSALNIAIVRALPDSMSVGVEMTIHFADDTLLEPDISVFEKSALIQSDANLSAIRPDGLVLVIEVASSTLAYDRELKSRLYARHGVREFWVIDANERVTWIHTGPSGDGWSSIVERAPQDALTTPALPGFTIRIGEIG